MTNHMEAAVEAGHSVNYGGNLLTTERVILAALPHIRAMVAQEIVSQHQDYVCINYENPGDDDHPRACVWEIIENIAHQLTGTNQITDNAAQIAEGTRP